MKNGDLTRAVARTTGLSEKDSENVIHTTVETIIDALAAKKKRSNIWFWKFCGSQ